MIHPLISAKEVYDIFTKDNVVLLDASRKIDSKNSILGAKHFDIKNTFSDTSTGLPNSFPDAFLQVLVYGLCLELLDTKIL